MIAKGIIMTCVECEGNDITVFWEDPERIGLWCQDCGATSTALKDTLFTRYETTERLRGER